MHDVLELHVYGGASVFLPSFLVYSRHCGMLSDPQEHTYVLCIILFHSYSDPQYFFFSNLSTIAQHYVIRTHLMSCSAIYKENNVKRGPSTFTVHIV